MPTPSYFSLVIVLLLAPKAAAGSAIVNELLDIDASGSYSAGPLIEKVGGVAGYGEASDLV